MSITSLDQSLQNFWDTGKFTSSWIISTDNITRSLNQIKLFAHGILGISDLPLENNPDFRIVERGLNSSKNEAKYISVEQIRELQSFMNSTSAVSNCKIAVIYEADLMNLNAYNCCLKILEEAPRDSYIFLLTSRPGNIIATIKSRCMKVSDINRHPVLDTGSRNDDTGSRIESGMTNKYNLELYKDNITQKMKYLQEVSGKDSKELWQGFCDNVLYYLRDKSDVKRFDQAQKLIKDTTDFDLDKKHMGILIMECLS